MGEQNKEKAEFEVERVGGSSSSAPAYGDETIFQSIPYFTPTANEKKRFEVRYDILFPE